MNTHASRLMTGLYGLKPWYAARLRPARQALTAWHVPPGALTSGGVCFAAAAGAVIALLPPGPLSGAAVTGLLAARLACANLDGGVARAAGRATRFGVVTNELGDRAADLAALAGCLALAPAALVATAGLAATLPSWISLAGATAGVPRVQGGPAGKTERCLLLALAAFTGAASAVLVVIAVGSVLTAALRLHRIWSLTREHPPAPVPGAGQ
jgi:CDP-diacylglycerol---glycerol-3-phosphate 3-phosphatidyltransferase